MNSADAAALGLPVSPEVPCCRPITFTVEFANSILSIIDNLDVDGLCKDECATLDELADVLRRAREKQSAGRDIPEGLLWDLETEAGSRSWMRRRTR